MRKPRATQIPLLGEAQPARKLFALHRPRASKQSAPAPRPWQCVVISVDQAERSGWCVTAAGRHAASGELDTYDVEAVRVVLQYGLRLAAALKMPCVLVYEGHTKKAYGDHSYAVPVSLLAALKIWLREWARAAKPYGHAGKHCPAWLQSWRSAVLGPHTVRLPRERVRPIEQAYAARVVGRAVGGDEAPAVCIGVYGSRSAAVGRLLGKRAKAASLAKWLEAR
jgi:hypothetical protein